MTIDYVETKTIELNALRKLYESVGWTPYARKPDKLARILERSLYVLSAWHDGVLVGLIRVVGDDTSIIYIQDILVDPAYQGKKIGTTLLKRVLKKYAHIRQIVLMTDNTEKTKRFYKSLGLQSIDELEGLAFVKVNLDA